MLSWTFIALVCGYVGIQLVAATGVFTRQITPGGTRVVGHQLSPHSGAFSAISIQSTWFGMSHAPTIELTLTLPDGSQHRASIDDDSSRFIPDVGRPRPWDAASIALWLTDLGLDAQSEPLAFEAQALGVHVDALLKGGDPQDLEHMLGGFTVTQSLTHSVSGPTYYERNRLALATAYVLILAGYVAGLVWIIRRRRRLLHPPPDAPR
jgi:hypothetical protein